MDMKVLNEMLECLAWWEGLTEAQRDAWKLCLGEGGRIKDAWAAFRAGEASKAKSF